MATIIAQELLTKLGFRVDMRGLHKMDSALTSFTRKGGIGLASIATKVLKVGTALATTAAAFTVFGVKQAADFEALTTSLEVLLGSKEKASEMAATLEDLGSRTPFQTEDLFQGAQMLLNYGFAQEKVIPLTKLLGDISLGSAVKFQRLSLAFSQVRGHGKLTGQELRQMVEAGFNPLQAAAEASGKSIRVFQEQQRSGNFSMNDLIKSMQSATSEGGRFHNGMLRLSQTLKGRLSTLRDNFKITFKALGQGFLPASKSITTSMINFLRGPLKRGFTELSSKLTPLLDALATRFGGFLEEAGPTVEAFFSEIAEGLPSLDAFRNKLISISTKVLQLKDAFFNLVGPVTNGVIKLTSEIGVGLYGTLKRTLDLFEVTPDTFDSLGKKIRLGLINPLRASAVLLKHVTDRALLGYKMMKLSLSDSSWLENLPKPLADFIGPVTGFFRKLEKNREEMEKVFKIRKDMFSDM